MSLRAAISSPRYKMDSEVVKLHVSFTATQRIGDTKEIAHTSCLEPIQIAFRIWIIPPLSPKGSRFSYFCTKLPVGAVISVLL